MIGSSAIGGPLLGSLSDAFGARILIDIGAIACFAAALWGHTMYGRYGPTEPGTSPATVLESKPVPTGGNGGAGL